MFVLLTNTTTRTNYNQNKRDKVRGNQEMFVKKIENSVPSNSSSTKHFISALSLLLFVSFLTLSFDNDCSGLKQCLLHHLIP